MKYYLVNKNNSKDMIELGLLSFGVFGKSQGMLVINLLLLRSDDQIENYQVIVDNGKVVSILLFINHLETLLRILC